MLTMIDFNDAEIARGVYYGGDAGAKNAILYEGEAWMLKYPKTTRGQMNPQVSYTTSPLSEYLGSRIYETLGIPVHETMLGVRSGKIVVACKDFTRYRQGGLPQESRDLSLKKLLVPFHDLKNSFMTGDVESYSGTGSETLLDEVLAALSGQEELRAIPGVTERFWDMFVVDAFIGNNDRNNGNWGILIDPGNGEASLAPVYDNGNAFFNKRSLAQMERRIHDEKMMREDAYLNPLCAYKYTGLDKEGQKINPFTFIRRGENVDCNTAVARFADIVDFQRIENLVRSIPETAGTLAVMPEIQKEFYLRLMQVRLDQVLLPAAATVASHG